MSAVIQTEAEFSYNAIDANGAEVSGSIVAANDRIALRALEKKGLAVTKVSRRIKPAERRSKQKIKHIDLLTALYEIVVMLRSGVPIVDVIESQTQSAHSDELKTSFSKISRALRQGASFSAALKVCGLKLPDYLLRLAESGEATGKLAESLNSGVEQMEYEQQLRNELRNALAYPAILVCSGILAVIVLFIFVVPNFTNLLTKTDELPLIAYVVLTMGDWCNHNAGFLGLMIVALVVTATITLQKPGVRSGLLNRVSKLPTVGAWLIEADIARWAKMMGGLLANKVPLLVSLEMANAGVLLKSRSESLRRVAREVKNGESLSRSLQQNDALTGTGYNLVAVGEKAGELPQMLASLAKLYDESGKNRMKRMLALVEPIAILLIGAVVGFIMLGIILAITSANTISI